ncbi:hypothetical protein Enr13x_24650 [Stieleria neptunia]|uniref:Uncharacterized protein n=1 Tax=Stieleria neptunia TaxID=2527979 RepID=A0A518HP42_9BACT|nr:hypothetical protein Enr13x_24650 [Stieleria neptunia]
MVKCPRCQNRPNECYPSRWYKQVPFLLTLRIRWRCMRCGEKFADWVWSEDPPNTPYLRPDSSPKDSSANHDDEDSTGAERTVGSATLQ